MTKFTRREALEVTAALLGGAAVAGSGMSLSGCQTSSDQVIEPARTLDVLAETEVLVLGGGPSGMSAAIAAAREGVDTMLVERYGSFGGVITQQTMGSIAWYRFAETVDAGGIRLEYEQQAKQAGATLDVFGEEARGVLDDSMLEQYHEFLEQVGLRVNGQPTYEILETELFKWVADEMLKQAGVTPLLHCWTVNALMDGRKIIGVVTESKSGRKAILAKRIIDCTGDADVANFAGAPFWQSPPQDLMECTKQFGMSKVDLQSLLLYIVLNAESLDEWSETGKETAGVISQRISEPFQRAIKAGEIPAERDMDYVAYLGCFTNASELPDMNTVHIRNVDPTDVFELTRAEIRGREGVVRAIQALKKYCPGFSEARLRTIAPVLGVRESRRIIGAYDITEDDIRNQARFEDSIGICPEFLDGYGIMLLPTTGRYFQVPYRIMLPNEVENLLVAGRSVSGDRISHAATRQMACCCVTGQGAGVAAAVSLKDGVSCRKVDIGRVQKRLKAQNVRIA